MRRITMIPSRLIELLGIAPERMCWAAGNFRRSQQTPAGTHSQQTLRLGLHMAVNGSTVCRALNSLISLGATGCCRQNTFTKSSRYKPESCTERP